MYFLYNIFHTFVENPNRDAYKISMGWSDSAMVLGKLSVLGCPTDLDNSRTRACCACSRSGWGLFEHFFSRLTYLSLIITLPKKGNLQLCQNYRTIRLISHSSKVMLKVIMNRLKPQAENVIAEEQAGFRAGRSTTEQIFNLRILCEKYLQHQQNLYHVFIDFRKAFDRV